MGSSISSMLGASATSGAESDSSKKFSVKKFDSADGWQVHFKTVKDSNQLMVAYFTASWSGSCKSMEPAVNAMASNFSDVQFAKINVDKLLYYPEFGGSIPYSEDKIDEIRDQWAMFVQSFID